MATSPLLSWPTPGPNDPPDGPAQVAALAAAAEKYAVLRFPTMAALTAALTAAGVAPVAGMKAVIGSGSAMVEYVHNGSGWAATYRPPQNFTPVATASSGAFTTVAATCRWSQVGCMVMATFSVAITTAGTASGNLLVTLPVTAANANMEHGSGREIAGTGAMLNAWISGPNGCSVTGYDNVGRIANGRTYRWSIAYEPA